MKQPPGHAQGKLVCHLKCPLYGLKQSGQHWYQKLIDIMMKLSFSRSDVDQAVFYRRDESSNRLIIILVHINDYSIMATSTTLITQFKAKIKTHVHITDMGDLHWILSIKVKRIREEGKILRLNPTTIQS
jgi:hypothetical protein